MNDKVQKSRVSNEQILAAILGLTEAIKGSALVTPQPTERIAMNGELKVAPQLKQVTVAQPSAGRLIAHLPQAAEIPKGIKVEWLAGLVRKATAWAAAKANGEAVFVYFVRKADGTHSPLFARASSKASANAVSIYQRVN